MSKTALIRLRATPEEKERLAKLAARRGLKPSALICMWIADAWHAQQRETAVAALNSPAADPANGGPNHDER